MTSFKLITVLALPLLFLSACKEEIKEVAPQIKAVKTIVVGEADGVNTRTLSGAVQAAQTSDLSFRVSGRVTGIKVNVGDTVKKGDVLAALEQKDYKRALSTAKANVQSAESEVLKTKEENIRQQKLLERGFVSKAGAQKADTEYEEALGKVKVAATKLQIAKDNLSRTILRAPFDGKIATKEIDNLGEVQAGEAIFLLQGAEGLEVEILVPETLIRALKQDDKATLSFPTLEGVSVDATITQIATRSQSGNAFPVTLTLVKSKADIRPGMTAEVALSITNGGNGGLLIPTSAVDLRFFDKQTGNANEESHVFVVDAAQSTLKLTKVRVSDVRGNQLEVLGGLNAGDRVVIAGVSFLSEGQKVKLWEPQYAIPATLRK